MFIIHVIDHARSLLQHVLPCHGMVQDSLLLDRSAELVCRCDRHVKHLSCRCAWAYGREHPFTASRTQPQASAIILGHWSTGVHWSHMPLLLGSFCADFAGIMLSVRSAAHSMMFEDLGGDQKAHSAQTTWMLSWSWQCAALQDHHASRPGLHNGRHCLQGRKAVPRCGVRGPADRAPRPVPHFRGALQRAAARNALWCRDAESGPGQVLRGRHQAAQRAAGHQGSERPTAAHVSVPEPCCGAWQGRGIPVCRWMPRRFPCHMRCTCHATGSGALVLRAELPCTVSDEALLALLVLRCPRQAGSLSQTGLCVQWSQQQQQQLLR